MDKTVFKSIFFCISLALKREDSTASTATNKRKVSSISASEGSDHGLGDGPESAAGGGGGDGTTSSHGASAAPAAPPPVPEDPLVAEMARFELPADDDALELNMPWLKVVSKLSNSFNFHCTHQNFCHPNCYRRQMRATKRIMEAARHVSRESKAFLHRWS